MSNMIFATVLVLSMVSAAAGHGYLMNPAARNSMWRFGFDNPKNYNDNELFCGGFRHHWVINKGKCGICGDPYGAKIQPHMDGGRYAKNKLIAKTYKRGQVIEVSARLTTTHKGYFQFRIGNYDNSIPKADKMGRLSGYLLKVVGGGDKFMLPRGARAGVYSTKLQLPADLTCNRCVMQWTYRGGNNWGCDAGGCGLGHGPQETFVNCADVKITN